MSSFGMKELGIKVSNRGSTDLYLPSPLGRVGWGHFYLVTVIYISDLPVSAGAETPLQRRGYFIHFIPKLQLGNALHDRIAVTHL